LENPLDNTQGGRFSNVISLVNEQGQRIANSFSLEADAVITGIHWWGYFLTPESNISNDFRIRFYTANSSIGDIPGDLIYELNIKPILTDTGLISTSHSTVVWELSSNPVQELSLIADQTYWLEIAYRADSGPDQWLWSRSSTTDGEVAFRNDDSEDWTPWALTANGDESSAFYLIGTRTSGVSTPIPTLSEWALLVIVLEVALIGLGYVRKNHSV
jgi:hypothetical protein